MLHTAYRKDSFSKRKSMLFEDIGETFSMSDLVPFDAMQAQFQRYQSEIDAFILHAKECQINSDEDASFNIEEAAKGRKLSNRLEEARKELLEPLKQATAQINSFAKGFIESLEKAIRQIASKEGAYQLAKSAAIEAQLAAERVLAEYMGQAMDVIDVEPIKATSTKSGSTYMRTDWDIEILDLKAVPIGCLELNETYVKQMLKAGITDISGLKITEKKINTLRSK